MRSLVRPLDRYVLLEWMKIFVTTALGLPFLLVIIDLTDHLQTYLNRNIPPGDIALSYVYWMPQSMFMALPAAVLFATVFSIGNFTRHSEITAAKASGISFYRLAAPILLGALLATVLDLTIAEIVPITDLRRNDLIGDTKSQTGTQRYNFAFAAEYGRVYKAQQLDVPTGRLQQLQIERKGNGKDYPTVLISAKDAQYTAGKGWVLHDGVMHVIRDSAPAFAMSFATMRDSMMTERPVDMMAKPRDPQEMRFAELSRFIRALERSGGDASVLRVERALKIAIPMTCLVIALFGAPLATSTQRGGTAYGIGLSLGITVTFLMLIQLTKAVGGKGIIAPDLAAWIPNALFAVMGVILLARVRT
ncbi:MAG TPA: LptF/LptG family permease [Gemmatimonadaceae bacterium]|nr:LptF/LptG family permease [Gemmatimonadaceae bacterium]